MKRIKREKGQIRMFFLRFNSEDIGHEISLLKAVLFKDLKTSNQTVSVICDSPTATDGFNHEKGEAIIR